TGVPPPRRRGGASDAAGATGVVDGRPTEARAFVGTVGLPAHGVSVMIILREVSTAAAAAASQALRRSAPTRARRAIGARSAGGAGVVGAPVHADEGALGDRGGLAVARGEDAPHAARRPAVV